MEALYFGETARQLFGVYHPPTGTALFEEAVLICPPIGHEYIRTHWALRQLASLLAAEGYHVLRFDYSGVGDSAGVFEDASLKLWLSNCQTAFHELKDISSAERVHSIGLRVGASLSLLLSSNGLSLRSAVYWDPVLTGRNYLQELSALHKRKYERTPKQYRRFREGELLGYGYGSELMSELGDLKLCSGDHSIPDDTLICMSSAQPEFSRWIKSVSKSKAAPRQILNSLFGDWSDPDQVEEALLPGPALQEIVRFFQISRGNS